jgi:galactokinase
MILTSNYFLFRSDDTVNMTNVKLKYDEINKISKNARFIKSLKAIIVDTNDKRKLTFTGFNKRRIVFEKLASILDYYVSDFNNDKIPEILASIDQNTEEVKLMHTKSARNERKDDLFKELNNEELESSNDKLSLFSLDDIDTPKDAEDGNGLHVTANQDPPLS